MTTPLFSVVIPVYNRAGIVGKAIRSVLDQDLGDFEILVVDDGSTDRPDRVVEAFGDPRIRLICQPNAGGGAARSNGIKQASGRYIAFLDSDDMFLPGKLSRMEQELTGDGNQVLFSQMRVDRGVEKHWIRPKRGIREGEDVGEYMFCANQFVQTSTMVVPTKLAKEVLFDPTLKRGQDLDFCVRLRAQGAMFRMIAEPLTVWLDASEAGRTSYEKGYESSLTWLTRCGHLLTPKARRGYRATVLAYHMGRVKPLSATKDLLLGWLLGGVPAGVIARQALRAYLPTGTYRALVNRFVARYGSER